MGKFIILMVVATTLVMIGSNIKSSTENSTDEMAIMQSQESISMLAANEEAVLVTSAKAVEAVGSVVASDTVIAKITSESQEESASALLNLESIGSAAPGDIIVAVTNDSLHWRMASTHEGDVRACVETV